jgi:hypothetical protein
MKHWALAVYWRSMPSREVETYLFTDTRGERGWLESKEEYPGVEALGKMREAGLQAAAKLLGIHQDGSLNYLDGELDQDRLAGGISNGLQAELREKYDRWLPAWQGVKVAHRSLRWSYFWTSLASNANFWPNFASRGRQSRVFGPFSTSVKRCFCGQTFPPAADRVWEKSQCYKTHSLVLPRARYHSSEPAGEPIFASESDCFASYHLKCTKIYEPVSEKLLDKQQFDPIYQQRADYHPEMPGAVSAHPVWSHGIPKRCLHGDGSDWVYDLGPAIMTLLNAAPLIGFVLGYSLLDPTQ